MPALRHLVFLLLSLPAQAVTLHGVIRHEAEKQPLLLDSLRYQHKHSGETYSITRASYLLSGFALQRATAPGWKLAGHVAWMDALKKRTQFALRMCLRAVTARCVFMWGSTASECGQSGAIRA
jgi:hypothetical protein